MLVLQKLRLQLCSDVHNIFDFQMQNEGSSPAKPMASHGWIPPLTK